jgi:hypothetical protein
VVDESGTRLPIPSSSSYARQVVIPSDVIRF